MLCPNCKQDAPVRDTRPQGEFRRRRYFCECGTRFTTLECVIDIGNNLKGLHDVELGKKLTKGERWFREQFALAKKEGRSQALEEVKSLLFGEAS